MKLLTLGIIAFTLSYGAGYFNSRATSKRAVTFVPGSTYTPKPGRYLSGKQLLRVALIDSGVDLEKMQQAGVPLCLGGHYNAITQAESMVPDFVDGIGHGTVMAKAIHSRAKGSSYCIEVIKVFPDAFDEGSEDDYLVFVARALRHAIKTNVNVINMSYRGPGYSHIEHSLLAKLSARHVIMFAAAGNESQNLNNACLPFPACYRDIPNLSAVGAKDEYETPAKYSNYGSMIKIWEYGQFEGQRGTSVSTALATGELVRFWSEKLTQKRTKK